MKQCEKLITSSKKTLPFVLTVWICKSHIQKREGRPAGFKMCLDWQHVNAVIFTLGFGVKSPRDDGTEHCWRFLSCIANMSGPMAKSISVVTAELP